MVYLITEIILFLLAAFGMGLAVGWFLWGRTVADCTEIEREQARTKKKLDAAQSSIRNLERKVASLQAEPTSHFPIPGSLSETGPVSEAELLSEAEPLSEAESVSETEPLSEAEPLSETEASSPEASGVLVVEAEAVAPAETADGPAAAAFMDDATAPLAQEGSAAQDDSPAYDDLKRISGIGPTVERQLAELGVTTYRQIAHFTDEDIERVGQHIDLFADRIRREGWVVQAAALHRDTYGTQP